MFTLLVRESALAVKNSSGREIGLSPYSEDVFVGDDVGILQFARDARGAVTGFTINREAARGVRFERIVKNAG
jgi:hypothetical protein